MDRAVWLQIHKLLPWTTEKIHFIIDAMDECDLTSIETFLTLLMGSLPENSREDVGGPPRSAGGLYWVILSRNEANIKEEMSSLLASKIAKSVDLEYRHKEVECKVRINQTRTGKVASRIDSTL